MLFVEGVADAIISKLTGHRPEELERYKHPSPAFRQQSVELVAVRPSRQLSTNLSRPPKTLKAA